jgi:cytidylate kinase
MTIDELASAGASGDYRHDEWLDKQLVLFGSQNHIVMESRLAHLWCPMAFNVRLVCSIETRSARRAEQANIAIETAQELIETRDVNDNSRYASLYPGCLWANNGFDLVIDTGTTSAEQTVSCILEKHTQWVRIKKERSILCEDAVGVF